MKSRTIPAADVGLNMPTNLTTVDKNFSRNKSLLKVLKMNKLKPYHYFISFITWKTPGHIEQSRKSFKTDPNQLMTMQRNVGNFFLTALFQQVNNELKRCFTIIHS